MKQVTLIWAALLTLALAHAQQSNTWSQKADFGGDARWFAVGFSIGDKGYLGTGITNNPNFYKDFWEYDPALDSWTQKADFGGDARYGAVGFSIGTKGYIGTGSSASVFLKDFWEYDPIANAWTQKADFGGLPRYFAVGFSIGSKGYLGTGSGSGHFKDIWEYDPSLDSWTQKADFGGAGRLGAAGFSIGNKGYLGTGYTAFTGISKDFWEYDSVADTWTQKANFAGGSREYAVGFSIGSKGYLGTGSTTSIEKKDLWEYDPAFNTWTQEADYGGFDVAGAVGFNIGSKGYIGTGDNFIYKQFWEYTPNECAGLMVYADADGDSYGDISNSIFVADCIVPPGYAADSSDCNDANSAIYPGALEILNGLDDDCNGIIDDIVCNIPSGLLATNITATSAKLQWDAVEFALRYSVRYKVGGTAGWTIIKKVNSESKALSGLNPGTLYYWEVKSLCSQDPRLTSEWSEKQSFTTSPLKLGNGQGLKPSLEIYPNPSSTDATIHLHLPQPSFVSVKIFAVNGGENETAVNQSLEAGDYSFSINTTEFSKGIYLVQLISETGIQSEKLIVQ